MTEKQAEAEIRYRLAKFLLFRLQEENLLTPEESEKVRQTLCKKYNGPQEIDHLFQKNREHSSLYTKPAAPDDEKRQLREALMARRS